MAVNRRRQIVSDDEDEEKIIDQVEMTDSSSSDGDLKTSKKTHKVQLFNHLEDKTKDALKTFTEISKCRYMDKHLGDSNQEEQMTCDCTEDWTGTINNACGEDSDCINRLTSVECINGVCSCGDDCQNQRFQKKIYAQVSVIETEKKGYGLRADKDIRPDSFLYEYIGDVIDEETFRERMVQYDQKGFKHFYFMMLQKGEFIDATSRGCLARFCNHSCMPNAYVDKWVVGKKLRMGIFAKRLILKGEEITFDYNVDRYGAQAQPCYCGEPNCIGFMGGKTQTDSASLLPQVVADALGITSSQEKSWLKMMKQSGRKIKNKDEDSNINEEFVNSLTMSPLSDAEVSRVMSALLRNQEILIINKLVERILLTQDTSINNRIIRMHGYEIFSTLIKDNWKDKSNNQMILNCLHILTRWPKMTKNKISSSKIESVLNDVVNNTDNEEIKQASSNLLVEWSELKMAYRIPKKPKENKSLTPALKEEKQPQVKIEDLPKTRIYEGRILPDNWEWAIAPGSTNPYFYNRLLNKTQWNEPTSSSEFGFNGNLQSTGNGSNDNLKSVSPSDTHERGFSLKRDDDYDESEEAHVSGKSNFDTTIPTRPAAFDVKAERELLRRKREMEENERLRKLQELEQRKKEEEAKRRQESLNAIIRKAQKEAEDKLLAAKREKEQEEELKKAASARSINSKKKRSKHHSHKSNNNKPSSEQPTNETIYKKLFAGVVPNMLKKYEREIGHENLKKCAKDIVNILVEKELKRHLDPPNELADEKKNKIKIFVKSYMEKFLIKYREKHDKKRSNGEHDEPDPKRVK